MTISSEPARRHSPIPIVTPIPLPDAEELRERIPKGHPRIGFRPGELEDLRTRLHEDPYRGCFTHLIEYTQSIVSKPLPVIELPYDFYQPERGPYDSRYHRTTAGFEWYRAKVSGRFKTMHAHLLSLLLAYRLTDDPECRDRADQIITAILKLNPKTTAYSNTHLFHGAITALSWALDYLWDELGAVRRDELMTAIIERAMEFHPASVAVACSDPLSSHAMAYGPPTMLAASLALVHHAPVAEQWLKDVLYYLNEVFPAYGGDDGGYAQGFGYGIGIGQDVMHLLKVGTGIDMFSRAWTRNYARSIIYFQPPYSMSPTFGDASGGEKSRYHKHVMQVYAGHLQDPYCQWYADQLDLGSPDRNRNLLSFHYHCPARQDAVPPADLPQAIHLADVGWVAMHSRLADGENSVMLLMKSSPYGSFNHSHADQNSFVLEAFCRPLLIDSGYYPWYGSPHDLLWTRQTRAHNAVLINGKGQGVWNMEATGRIAAFRNTDEVAYAAGDATAAYQQPSIHGAPLDLCACDQGIVRVARHFVFIRPDTIVILDDIKTREPASVQFLLHALNPFEIDHAGRTITAMNAPARATIHLLGEDPLGISQADQFSDPPEREGGGAYPDQWHATCDFASTERIRRLLTVIQIGRTGQETRLPCVERVASAGSFGARIGATTVMFDLDAEPGKMSCKVTGPGGEHVSFA